MSDFVTTHDSVKIAVDLSWPKDASGKVPVVVLCHGYASAGGRNNFTNTNMVPRLTKCGIAAATFDFRGHGSSEGKIENVNVTTGLDDFGAVYEFVRQQPGVDKERIAVLGGSYGGIVAIRALVRHPEISCGVLKAPVVDWADARKQRYGESVMHEWKANGEYAVEYNGRKIRVPYSFIKDAEKHTAYDLAPQIPQPVLVFHGDADNDIPVEQSKKFVKSLPDGKLVILKDADHGFSKIEDANRFFDEAEKFIQKNLLN